MPLNLNVGLRDWQLRILNSRTVSPAGWRHGPWLSGEARGTGTGGRWRLSTYLGSMLGTARESFLFEICLRRHCLKGCKTQPEPRWSFRTKRKSAKHGCPLGFAEPLIGNAIGTSLVLFGDHLVYLQFLILDEVKQMYDTPTCICI